MSAYIGGSKSNLRQSQLSGSSVQNGRPATPRGTKSEAGFSTHSQKSTASKTKTYPRKGSTLGNIELSPEEMEHLEKVIERFDKFRTTEEHRVRTLRDQLVEKQKVRIRNAEASGDGHCYNCGRLFMALFNPPIPCYLCKHEFCRMCLEKMPKSKELICKFCRFESVHRGRLGVWFTEELKTARSQGRVRGVSGPEALRSSLLRLKRESRANSLIQNAASFSPSGSFLSLDEYDHGRQTDEQVELACESEPNTTSIALESNEYKHEEDVIDEDLNTIFARNVMTLEHAAIQTNNAPVNDQDRHMPPRSVLEEPDEDWTSPCKTVDRSPLKTSTVMCTRDKMSFGEFEASIDPQLIVEQDASNQGTPIQSVTTKKHSYESGLQTPEDTGMISGPPAMGMLDGDSTGAEAQAHLEAKRRFRRVRYFGSHGSMESLPAGSDSGYGHPRTENWVNEAQTAQDQRSAASVISQSEPRPQTPRLQTGSESDISFEQVPSVVSDRIAGSVASGSRPVTPSVPRRDIHSSFSDLRSHTSQIPHKARLTSEAGSKSTLSLASKNSPNLGAKSSPVLRVESHRKSGLITEEEFGEPGVLQKRVSLKRLTGSFRSLGQPGLYRRTFNTGSMLSIYSERESSYTHGIQITGDLRLDIRYDKQSSTLRISVKQARDLAIVDKKSQACNPYVKAYLLPDKTKASKRKTSYKKHNRNPVFEEELKYNIPYGDLSTRSLQISVWHKASVGANLFLGEVIIPLSEFSFDSGAQWYPLSERRQLAVTPSLQIFRGELLIALKLVPGGTMGRQSELHVWIKSAKGLTTSTSGRSKSSSVDPYCKVYLMPDKAKSSKRKTNVLKKNNNPEWNTNFVYQNIDRAQLNGMGLEISIWDHDRLSSNDFLGGCRINNGSLTQNWMDATGTEQSVWVAMMGRPTTWFEGLIRLRSNLD